MTSLSFIESFTKEIEENLDIEHRSLFKKYIAEAAMSVEKGRLTSKEWLERIDRKDIDYYDNIKKWIDFIHIHPADVPHSCMFAFMSLSNRQYRAGPYYLKLLTEMVMSKSMVDHIVYQLDDYVETRARTPKGEYFSYPLKEGTEKSTFPGYGYPSEGAVQLIMRSAKEGYIGIKNEEAVLIREMFVRLTTFKRVIDVLRSRKELRDDIMSLGKILDIDLSIVRERVYVW